MLCLYVCIDMGSICEVIMGMILALLYCCSMVGGE